jgi:hypothetical protein
MKQYAKLFSCIALLGATTSMLQASSTTTSTNNNMGARVVPFIQWRSQGRNNARKLEGTTSYAIDLADYDNTYGTFFATVEYDQNFRGYQITDALFGPALVNFNTVTGTSTTTTTTTTNNNCNNSCNSDQTIVISGLASVVAPATRVATDLMAENFLLPRDFRSTITFSPRVQNVMLDLDLFVGLDRWVSGLYFRLYGPIAWNRVSLRPDENVINKGTASVVTAGAVTAVNGGYQQGFFDPSAAVPTQALFTQALSYFGGCTFPDDYALNPASVTLIPNATAVTVQPLKFAKFSECNLPTTPTTTTNNCNDSCSSFRHHKTGFAELRGEFGYNYIQDNYRLMINLQAAAPTGTKIKAEYLLPAYVGNGHHWELGVGLGGAWKMWCNEDAERSFNFIVEADITHLFNAKQERTFDLLCKPLSRYMLAEQLVTPPVTDSLIPPTPTFSVVSGAYAPVANITTRDVKVSIGVQGDLVAMFNYTCRGFSWDLGYNFWAMSSSKIKLSDDCDDSCGIINPFPTNWALKGDASVAGYTAGAGTALSGEFGLGATETGATSSTGATIFAGTGTAVNSLNLNIGNAGIDNILTPGVGADDSATPPAPVPLFAFAVATATPTPISTSNPPIFITASSLDIKGAEQRGLSHKVFTHLSYTWKDCSDRWMPYVGAGVSAEFGSHSNFNNDCNTTTTTTTTASSCDTCPSSLSIALSQWAVEIKGGVSFH